MEQEKRPGLYEFTSDTPEFYRWYEYGGKPRETPLNLEELEQFYRAKGYATEEAKAAAWSSGARPPQVPAREKTTVQDQDENSIEPTLAHEKVRTADEEVEKFLRRRDQRGVGVQLDSPEEKNRAAALGQQIETQNALPETYRKAAVVPEQIKKQYLQVGNRFYYEKNPDQVAFEDKGNKLHTKSDGVNVASSMVEIAQARGWTEIRARGSEDFRRNVWLKAQARGIEVKGYEPKEADLAVLEKQLRERGEREPSSTREPAGKVMGRIPRTSKEVPVDRLSGELVDHGPAPFEFDQNNPTNYFAKLKNSDGKERLVWGVDLGRALEEKDAKRGDRITLENLGKQSVTVEGPIKDEQGKKIGTEPVEVLRNTWKVHAQAVREKKPEDLVRDHPDLSNEAATLKLAEKVARWFPKEVDQKRFMEQVQNRVAAKVEHGQTSPQIKLKETREVRTVREERVQGR